MLGRVLLLVAAADAAYCTGKPAPGAVSNNMPIMTGPPVLVSTVPNGKLFTVGSGDDAIPVVHLWGTPYEKGLAHAQLRNASIITLMNNVMAYIEDQAAQALNQSDHHLKPWFVDLVADLGVQAALEATHIATSKFTGKYFDEELSGMSEGTGLPLRTFQHVHMIGELTKGSCSLYGAWGNATKSTGSVMQLRALDWDVDGPFKDHPELIVYHANTDEENSFVNVAWSGFIGSITGMSEQQMAISEIGVSFPDDTFGSESRFGVPFTYLLRDILQFDRSIPAVEEHLGSAHRTCDLIFGVGDGKAASVATGKPFRSVQYSASVANFFTDVTMEPLNSTWHPRMNDVVYYGMDWLCPGFSTVLHAQLDKHYGNITPETTIRDIVPIVETGNLHVAVYDLSQMTLHVANARKSTVTSGAKMAFGRSFIALDMKAIFSEKSP